MFITASAGLYLAQENLKLALKEPQDTEAFRRYVRTLKRQVKRWKLAIEEQRDRKKP